MIKTMCRKCGRITLHSEGRAEKDGEKLFQPLTCLVCATQWFVERPAVPQKPSKRKLSN